MTRFLYLLEFYNFSSKFLFHPVFSKVFLFYLLLYLLDLNFIHCTSFFLTTRLITQVQFTSNWFISQDAPYCNKFILGISSTILALNRTPNLVKALIKILLIKSFYLGNFKSRVIY